MKNMIVRMFKIRKVVRGYVYHDAKEANRKIAKLDAMGLIYTVEHNIAYDYYRIEVYSKIEGLD